MKKTDEPPAKKPLGPVAAKAWKDMQELIKNGAFDRLEELNERAKPLARERETLDCVGKPFSSGAALKHYQLRECANVACTKSEDKCGTLRSCAKCVESKSPSAARYCSRECQVAHGPSHRAICGKAAAVPPEFDGTWVDKWRGCGDGTYHFGTLDLISWDGVDRLDESEWATGFGGALLEEGDEMRDLFVNKYHSNCPKFCKFRPKAFRWTCCGVSVAVGVSGCDHHGNPSAHTPCRCDFCLAGKPLNDGIWWRKLHSQAAQGLQSTLLRGPDPKSLCESGLRNWELRSEYYRLMGLKT